VPRARIGNEDHAETGAADAQRPFDVFDIGEELGVEEPGPLNRGA